jgi:hypothetical protein
LAQNKPFLPQKPGLFWRTHTADKRILMHLIAKREHLEIFINYRGASLYSYLVLSPTQAFWRGPIGEHGILKVVCWFINVLNAEAKR